MAVGAHEQQFAQPLSKAEKKNDSREFGKIALGLFTELQELGQIDPADVYSYETGVFDLMSTNHSQGDILRVTIKTGKITSYRWITLFPDDNKTHLYVPAFGNFDPVDGNFKFLNQKPKVQEIGYSDSSFSISDTAKVIGPLGIPQGSVIISIELFPGLAKEASKKIEKSQRPILDKISDITTPSDEDLEKDAHQFFLEDVHWIWKTIRKVFPNRK